MGIRADQRRRTRHAILEAAAAEFEERGYQATSYASVAARAGLAKSLVSYHFGSKNDLVRAMFEESFSPQGMFPLPPTDVIAPLDDLAESTVAAASSEQTSVIVRAALRLRREAYLIDVRVPPPFVGWTARCVDRISLAARLGHIRHDVDVEFEAHLLVAQYIGIRDLAAASHDYERLMERTAIGSLDRFVAMGATPAALAAATQRAAHAMRVADALGVERVEARLALPRAGAQQGSDSASPPDLLAQR
jgi:AcrR family transcriptional regulator